MLVSGMFMRIRRCERGVSEEGSYLCGGTWEDEKRRIKSVLDWLLSNGF
jgi:hypothetical protein